MKRIALIPRKSPGRLLGLSGIILGLALLPVLRSLADISGPVVGFQRIDVEAGSQYVTPSVLPFAPDQSKAETTAQSLTSYFGEEFVARTNADNSDWIGCTNSQDGASSVKMIWRDQQGQWRDLLGNTLDPDCANTPGFWLDLVFGTELSTSLQTRELVLSGRVVW